MSNRVAELESAVAQLQATVDGLREELVDANERIRSLEQALDESDQDEESESTEELETSHSVESSNESEDEAESIPEQLDDIIVA